MFIVAGVSSAADCAVCMEMNQLLILQPRGGQAGSMAGSFSREHEPASGNPIDPGCVVFLKQL